MNKNSGKFTLIELLAVPVVAFWGLCQVKPGEDLRQIRRAFTLIELLVVIAIIAILASLLLPALAKARQSVKTLVCLNNMKNLGITCFNYSNDNDGAVVPVYTTDSGEDPWIIRLIPYYLKSSRYFIDSDRKALKLADNQAKATVIDSLYCPITTGNEQCKKYYTDIYIEARMMYNSYGVNPYNGIIERTASNYFGNERKIYLGKLSRISNPSSKIQMTETAYAICPGAWGAHVNYIWDKVSNVSFRHGVSVTDSVSVYEAFLNGTTSTVYHDGHVSSLPYLARNSSEWEELLVIGAK